ncbi:MAG TPA: sigma-70 family RNA polymerase sigma factor [Gaiellaceae bacterium]|jgi:RNA polymerase sigma-70 factor (ECF subfamily)
MDEARVWSQVESLYRAHFSQFERVARAIVGDRDLALEAVQEGFADALRHAGEWESRGPLEGWVWRCVVNRARKTRRRPVLEMPADARRPDDGHDESELLARLAELPERQRLVVFLRYFADLEYREIAAALEIETGTVSATLHAAHANLRAGYEEALV